MKQQTDSWLTKQLVNWNSDSLRFHPAFFIRFPQIFRFFSDPELFLVSQIGRNAQVIRALSSYHPQRVELNGRMGGHRASVNVKVGSSVSLEISLLKPEDPLLTVAVGWATDVFVKLVEQLQESQHLEPLEVSGLLVTVYDVEDRKNQS